MRNRARLASIFAIGAAMTLSLLAVPQSAQAAPVLDGSAPHRAAASCWEIKQTVPTAPSGRYWLLTPQLQAPAQFYCDQTTDGGGWVLIARGRHGWLDGGDGRGPESSVGSTVTGPSAFFAKQLSGTTIDALLGGGRVDALGEGIRLKRSTNQAGTTSQEVRFKLASRDRWSWALGADPGLPVSSYTVDGVTTTKKQIARDLTLSSDTQRTFTGTAAASKFVRGFLFGPSGPKGSTSTTSYLYSPVASGQWAAPFTQVFVRPRLMSSSLKFAAVPDAGAAAQAAPAIPESGALPQPWGVAGLGKGGTNYLATEVSAFAQIGNRVYVGGNFTQVRRNDGSAKYSQPYLAAFDAKTGNWISSFRPKLNNQVKALAALPNGRLAVGGQFSKVNGKTAAALVVLDAGSGRTHTKFKAAFGQTTKGAKRWVRSLDVSGKRLYIGGGFTSYRGGSKKTVYKFRNILRVSATTGKPDTNWRPNLGTGFKMANNKRSVSSSVLSLDVSPDGRMVYAAGQFTQGYVGSKGKKAVSRPGAAAIRTTKKATFQSWPVKYSSANKGNRYQQTVKRVGGLVWLGGSQHSFFGYTASKLALTFGHITLQGGDMQATDNRGNIVYSSCHCNGWNYSGTTRYDVPRAAGAKQVDRIGYVGAWNAATGSYYPQFAPESKMRGGEGPWAVFSAADGTLWSGGDYVSVVGRDGVNRAAAGFARFALRPHTPPARPGGLAVTLSGSSAKLTWKASSTRGVSYEIVRNNRVVALAAAGATTVTVPDSVAGDRWFVRATDGRGNRSATTSVARAAG